jgi:NAD(P)-dependent dehydrogenase (short-subunit alcohol dehydrogenase family)
LCRHPKTGHDSVAGKGGGEFMTGQKIALVTGANRGIGAAIVKGLAARGDIHVLAAARNPSSITVVPRVTAVPLDLTTAAIRKAHIAVILKAHPRIDILVNNAGVLHNGALLELDGDKLVNTIEVNYLAPIDLIRAIVPGMVQRGFGRIVNLSSGWGSFEEGLTGPPSYSMTKAALNGLTLSLAHELPANVKVNSCCPGWVRTDMGGPGATRAPEHGAETPIWLATLPDDGPNGGFFRDRQRINW